MRVGVIYPVVRRWRKMQWVACALRRLGVDVVAIHDLEHLAAVHEQLDLVIFAQRGAGLNHTDVIALAEKRTCPWVIWWFDLLAIEPGVPLAKQTTLQTSTSQNILEPTDDLQVMRVVDCVFVKEGGLVDQYAALDVNAHYLDQGCPDWIHECKHHEVPEWDVFVWGNTGKAWKARRHDVNEIVSEGFAVAWAGHAAGHPPAACLPLPWCPPTNLPVIMSKAAVALSVSMRSDVIGYTSDRLWIAMGMGACVVARHFAGMPMGLPVRVYRGTADMLLAIQQLRADRGRRAAMGKAARRWVMKHRTVKTQCERLLEKCKRLQKKSAANVEERDG